MASTHRPALPALTSLRFFAALFVLLYHLDVLKLGKQCGWLWPDYFSHGPVGVGFFFVLSGFVLAYSYADRFRTLRAADLWAYAVARYARIYPLHFVAFGLVLFPYFRSTPWPADGLSVGFQHLTLTQAWNTDLDRAVLTHNAAAWSLSVEVFFYALLPPLLFALCRVPARHSAALLALAAVLCVAHLRWQYAQMVSGNPDAVYRRFVYPPGRAAEFVVGVLVGLAFARRPASDPVSRPGWRGTLLEVLAVGMVVAQFRAVSRGYLPDDLKHVGYYTPSLAVLIAVFARHAGHLAHALSCGPLVLLGEASYALYLLHYPVLTVVVNRPPYLGTAWPELAAALTVLGAVGVSVLAHLYLELPLRRLSMYLLRGRWGRRPVVLPFASAERSSPGVAA